MSSLTHWYFGPFHPADSHTMLCPEFAIGDGVVDRTNGSLEQVDCSACLTWIHA